MTGRAYAIASALLLGGLCAYGSGSCVPTPLVTPTGTPESVTSFSIASPRPGACVQIPDPCPGNGPPCPTVPITLDPIALNLGQGQFSIRPPGACGQNYNCGHIQLYVDGVLNGEGAGSVVDVNLQDMAVPYREMTITVELVDDCGNPWLPAWNNIILDEANGYLPATNVGLVNDGGILCLPTPDGGNPTTLSPGYADAGLAAMGPYFASVTITTAASCTDAGSSSSSSTASSSSSSSSSSASSSSGAGGGSSSSASSSSGAGGSSAASSSSAAGSSSGGTGGGGTGGGGMGDAGADAGDAGDGG
jgi:hypothetical protein